MELFIGFIIIAFFIILGSTLFSTRKKKSLKNDPIPKQLGIQKAEGIPIVKKLDQSLTNSYIDNVKNRVLQEHPKWKDHEFDWGMFELKRYFLMNSLLKSVPMFSHHVDEIWHEMLMFTRDYDKFSKDFYHDTLHHTPNMDITPIPGERAFFDWVYISLFEVTTNSRVIWGRFLQNPIKREIIDDFRQLSEDELLSKYFRKNEDWLEVKTYLIRKMKNEIFEAEQQNTDSKKFTPHTSTSDTNIYSYAAMAAIFYSLYDEDQFHEHMSEVVPEEYDKGVPYSGGSSCSGFACSSGSGDSGGGGDSGGSSCSSCGGGCSS
ncbi:MULTISPECIES: hypothetical protein [Bacillaceae]|uniref:hypothetical protein n=1 Tax=Bacillaceae TaxID=186817 RepID=UPI000BFDE054|nr:MULTISPECIES: hypothetical protein [Bacillaceae]PGT80399.1 hypothetical protein COD11_21335 [Bacillus sp. AFS040349]UGB31242.1 hypothetical protein LPC09_01490 [Metabacillus sp. B2-18]